jgi:hypothetical protein
VATSLKSAGIITTDEARELMGWPPATEDLQPDPPPVPPPPAEDDTMDDDEEAADDSAPTIS